MTSWHDVDGVDKVAKLDASSNPIAAVPEAIGKFHSLWGLRLQKCQVQAIDDAISSLPHLREVWLADNPLQKLPDGVRNLKNLHHARSQARPCRRK